MVTSESKVD